MKTKRRNRLGALPRVAPYFAIVALIATLAGCERDTQSGDAVANQPGADQGADEERPLGQVMEFDGFTLRANVSATESLPDAMARRYGIEAGPDVALLNLVVLAKRPDQPSVTVSAEVSARHESLIGHPQVIDMREVEADGHVSYIGTLDTRAERIFRFVIEAQPAGTGQPLQMNFEVQLPTLDAR